jgi:hypothetical protein
MKFIGLGLVACLMAGAAMGQTTGTTSKDSNVAVQTQEPVSAVPAKGSNSFTEGQAKSRIEGKGYTNVSDLKKDDDGVWRGRARKGGDQVSVWVDYKGAVGQGS